jgi:hypothetical protein
MARFRNALCAASESAYSRSMLVDRFPAGLSALAPVAAAAHELLRLPLLLLRPARS